MKAASFLLLFVPPSSCFAVLSASFSSQFPHGGGGEGQAGTLFFVSYSFGEVSVLLSVFLSYFLSLSLALPSLF